MTTTTIQPPPVPRKLSWDFEPGYEHCWPDHVEIPGPLVEPNARARHAIQRYHAARDSAETSREAIAAAERADEAAREAALAADAVAPAPTAGIRRAEAAEAERQVDATCKIARREVMALYEATRENYPAYRKLRAASCEAAEAEPLKLARKLAAAWPRAMRERAMLTLAEQFHPQPAVVPLYEPRRDPSYERAADYVRQALKYRPTTATVPLDLTHIIAALGVLLEQEGA